MPARLRDTDPVIAHPLRHPIKHQSVQSRALGHRGVEVQKHAARRQRVVYRPVRRGLGLEIMDVVKRQGSDNRVRGRQRIQKACLPKRDPIRKVGQPSAGRGEHVRIDVEDRDPGARQPVEHRRRERTCAAAQIEDVSIGRSKRREHLDTRRDHLVVVRNEPPDLNVIALGINPKVTLDRMRLTGHDASLHLRPSTS
jgi:hypothetical protein